MASWAMHRIFFVAYEEEGDDNDVWNPFSKETVDKNYIKELVKKQSSFLIKII